jgi:hypothetical protein
LIPRAACLATIVGTSSMAPGKRHRERGATMLPQIHVTKSYLAPLLPLIEKLLVQCKLFDQSLSVFVAFLLQTEMIKLGLQPDPDPEGKGSRVITGEAEAQGVVLNLAKVVKLITLGEPEEQAIGRLERAVEFLRGEPDSPEQSEQGPERQKNIRRDGPRNKGRWERLDKAMQRRRKKKLTQLEIAQEFLEKNDERHADAESLLRWYRKHLNPAQKS